MHALRVWRRFAGLPLSMVQLIRSEIAGEVRARERICSVKESLRYNHWLLNVGSNKLLLELHNHQGRGLCTFKCTTNEGLNT